MKGKFDSIRLFEAVNFDGNAVIYLAVDNFIRHLKDLVLNSISPFSND